MSSQANRDAEDEAAPNREPTFDDAPHQRPLTVGEVMTPDVAACRPEESLERCAQIMWERACGCVPVVDGDNRPVSVITDRDVCMAAYIQGSPLSAIPVSSAMSKRLFTVDVRETVSTAEGIMRRFCVRRLPVIDGLGQLVGILSIDDITKHGRLGPLLGHDPLSVQAIAGTTAALGHPSSPKLPE